MKVLGQGRKWHESDDRRLRVARLRMLVRSGRYVVDPEATARDLIDRTGDECPTDQKIDR